MGSYLNILSRLKGKKQKYTFRFKPFLCRVEIITSKFLEVFLLSNSCCALVSEKTFLTQPPDFFEKMCSRAVVSMMSLRSKTS